MRREVLNEPGGIDVSLDEMPAKAITGAKGSLEVDEGTGSKRSKRGNIESLGQDVERKGLSFLLCHREAAAVDRDAIAKRDLGGKRDLESEASLISAFFEADRPPGRFYKAGEHSGLEEHVGGSYNYGGNKGGESELGR